jgi:UPF0716 family protein affecting phage T7 exclusion
VNWAAGVIAVYAALFGIGKVIFGEWALGLLLLAIAVGAFFWIAQALRVADRVSAARMAPGAEVRAPVLEARKA